VPGVRLCAGSIDLLRPEFLRQQKVSGRVELLKVHAARELAVLRSSRIRMKMEINFRTMKNV